MTLVTFTGENASGYVAYWGYHFPCGEAVSVEGEAIEAAKRHPEFMVEAPAKAENPPAESLGDAVAKVMAEMKPRLLEDTAAPAVRQKLGIGEPKQRRTRRKKA